MPEGRYSSGSCSCLRPSQPGVPQARRKETKIRVRDREVYREIGARGREREREGQTERKGVHARAIT